jgi:tripartite-type tricarboxylate transporter receptor subunit TctC
MKTVLLAVALFLLQIIVVEAQTPYFQGKTIRIVTGYPAGDVNDLWPRLIAQHMTKYIPGNPNFVIQNMPGASSMIAANYVFSVAKPDALTLGWIAPTLYFDQLVRAQRNPIRLGQIQLYRLAVGKRASTLHAHG